MNPLLRRLSAIERAASPPVSMGDCFVCCLQSVDKTIKGGSPSEWKPCKPGCRENMDRWNRAAEELKEKVARERDARSKAQA